MAELKKRRFLIYTRAPGKARFKMSGEVVADNHAKAVKAFRKIAALVGKETEVEAREAR